MIETLTFLGAAAAREVEVVDILEVKEPVDISLLTDEILQTIKIRMAKFLPNIVT